MKSTIFFILITFILSIKLKFEKKKKEELALSEMKKLQNFNLLVQSLKSIQKDLDNIKKDFNKSIEDLGKDFFSNNTLNYYDEDILVKDSKIHYIRNIFTSALNKFGYKDYLAFYTVVNDNLAMIKDNNWVHIYYIFNNRELRNKLNCVSVFINQNKRYGNINYDYIFIKFKSDIAFNETFYLDGIYNAKNGKTFEKEDWFTKNVPIIFKDKTDSIIFLYRILTYKYLLNIFSIDISFNN